MLMFTQASRYAHQLLDAHSHARLIPPLSSQGALSEADGYDVIKRIIDIRTAQGGRMIGRKIGFTNQRISRRYGVHAPIDVPIWTPLFDGAVRFADDNRAVQSLVDAMQPRLGAELVFKLSQAPRPKVSLEELAECIEWMAHGLEVVTCPFPDWKFDLADAIAAFGLHGVLTIGEPKGLSAASRRNLGTVLASSSVSLSCGNVLRAAGFGADVRGSPLHALWHLHRLLNEQDQFAPLAAGEIVTTGSWTDLCPIQPGEAWTSAFSGLSMSGLTLSFV